MNDNQNPPQLISFHGLPALQLRCADGAQAVITLHGGHLVSWIPAAGGERLYLSETSAFDGRQAIRGGVPVIFPQFGPTGPLPRHGFARTSAWKLEGIRQEKEFALATLTLDDDETTRQIWPHAFHLELSVGIGGDRLDMELEVENPGAHAFSFTSALHTYLRVAEVENILLEGLNGTLYQDQTKGNKLVRDTGVALTVEGEVDRIYQDAPPTLLLRDPGRPLGVHSEGFTDTVVWNPWEDKCAALKDMPARDFRHMLCIEAGCIATPILLEPGASWFGRQTLMELRNS